MAPGYFSESPFFPCGPLELEEYNLDYQGNLTLCCQLSGYSGPASYGGDVIGNLKEITLTEACECFRQRVATYLADKRDKINRGEFSELDHFPCWYCLKYLGKTSWLNNFPNHPWHAQNGSFMDHARRKKFDLILRSLIQSSMMERSFFFIWRARCITASIRPASGSGGG